jgi:hypothetical protein
MSRYLLDLTAVAAFVWVLARAALQSITIDEATTYELHVNPMDPVHWLAASNNHILNSAIVRFFDAVFGLSHLTMRSGALMGALVYILAANVLCRWLSERPALRWSAFVCLVFNPFIMDYLVVARGYGLAAAFLLCLFAVIARYLRGGSPRDAVRDAAWCSVLAALCIAANFSFAIVCAAAVAVLSLVASRGSGAVGKLKILAACTVPGLLVSAFLTLHAVLEWPAGQLWYGATSIGETARTLIESSLHEPNPNLLNPLIMPVAKFLRGWLIPAVLTATLVHLTWVMFRRASSWRLNFAAIIASTIGLTIAAHWLAFRSFGMLLPKERTALYVVVLLTLLVISVLSVKSSYVTSGVLMLAALYFVGCLRLTYFREWRWNAGVNQAYHVLAYYNHNRGLTSVASSWHYSAALNCYRVMSGRESLAEITGDTPIPTGRELYVLHEGINADFIGQQQLRIVWRGPESICVAIAP